VTRPYLRGKHSKQRAYVWRISAGLCQWCLRQCSRTPGDTLQGTIDHIVPRSRGGTDARDNLQLLCRRCNLAKGST